jgi:uncharacterized damage-inducible protein DinB
MSPEVKASLDVLEELHKDIFKVVDPLTDEHINWVHPQLSNTVGILLRHIAGSERYWIGEVVGGQPAHRERATEFAHEALKKGPLVEALRGAHASVKQVLQGLTPSDLQSEVELPSKDQPWRVTKAWALLHSLSHTAYHLGQLRLFRKIAPAGNGP